MRFDRAFRRPSVIAFTIATAIIAVAPSAWAACVLGIGDCAKAPKAQLTTVAVASEAQTVAYNDAKQNLINLAITGVIDKSTADQAIARLPAPETLDATKGGPVLASQAIHSFGMLAPSLLSNVDSALTTTGGALAIKDDQGAIVATGGSLADRAKALVTFNDNLAAGMVKSGLIDASIQNQFHNLVAAGGGNLITQDGGGIVSRDGAGIVSRDGAGVVSNDGAGLITQDGGGLLSEHGAAIISDNSAGLVAAGGGNFHLSADAAKLITQDGGGLVSNSGSTLVGNAGGTLVGNAGGTLVSNSGGTLVGNASGTLVSNSGSTALPNAQGFFSDNGSGLVANANLAIGLAGTALIDTAAAGALSRSVLSVEDKGTAVATALMQPQATLAAANAANVVTRDRAGLDMAIASKDQAAVAQWQAKLATDTPLAQTAMSAIVNGKDVATLKQAVASATADITDPATGKLSDAIIKDRINALPAHVPTVAEIAASTAATANAAATNVALDAAKAAAAKLASDLGTKPSDHALDAANANVALAQYQKSVADAKATLAQMRSDGASASALQSQQDIIDARQKNVDVTQKLVDNHYADKANAATAALGSAAQAQQKVDDMVALLGTNRPSDPKQLATLNALMAEARLTKLTSDQASAQADIARMSAQGASASDIQNRQVVLDSSTSQIATIAPIVNAEKALTTDGALNGMAQVIVATRGSTGSGGGFIQSSTTTIGGNYDAPNGSPSVTTATAAPSTNATPTPAVPMRTLQSVDGTPASMPTQLAAGGASAALKNLTPDQMTALVNVVPKLGQLSDDQIQTYIAAAKIPGALQTVVATLNVSDDQKQQIVAAGSLLAAIPADQATQLITVAKSASQLPADSIKGYIADVQGGMSLADATTTVKAAVSAQAATKAMNDLVTQLGSRPADPDQLKQVNVQMAQAGLTTYQSTLSQAKADLNMMIANKASASDIKSQQDLVAARQKNVDVTQALIDGQYATVQVDAQVAASTAQSAQAKVDALIKVLGTDNPTDPKQAQSLNALRDAASLATAQSQKATAAADVVRMTAQGAPASDIAARQTIVDVSSRQIAVIAPTVESEKALTSDAALIQLAQGKVASALAAVPTLPGTASPSVTASSGGGPVGGGAPMQALAATPVVAVPVAAVPVVAVPVVTPVVPVTAATAPQALSAAQTVLSSLSADQMKTFAGVVPTLGKYSPDDVKKLVTAASTPETYAAYVATLPADQRAAAADMRTTLAAVPPDQVGSVLQTAKVAASLPPGAIVQYLTEVKDGTDPLTALQHSMGVPTTTVAAVTATATPSTTVTPSTAAPQTAGSPPPSGAPSVVGSMTTGADNQASASAPVKTASLSPSPTGVAGQAASVQDTPVTSPTPDVSPAVAQALKKLQPRQVQALAKFAPALESYSPDEVKAFIEASKTQRTLAAYVNKMSIPLKDKNQLVRMGPVLSTIDPSDIPSVLRTTKTVATLSPDAMRHYFKDVRSGIDPQQALKTASPATAVPLVTAAPAMRPGPRQRPATISAMAAPGPALTRQANGAKGPVVKVMAPGPNSMVRAQKSAARVSPQKMVAPRAQMARPTAARAPMARAAVARAAPVIQRPRPVPAAAKVAVQPIKIPMASPLLRRH